MLNQSAYRSASVVSTASSAVDEPRAPWALKDFGIRAVISTSFADIFYNSYFKNGITDRVTKAQLDALMDDAEKAPTRSSTLTWRPGDWR